MAVAATPHIPALATLCMTALTRHVACLDDVGHLSDHLLTTILLRATPVDLPNPYTLNPEFLHTKP
jgi:hypothetical protein